MSGKVTTGIGSVTKEAESTATAWKVTFAALTLDDLALAAAEQAFEEATLAAEELEEQYLEAAEAAMAGEDLASPSGLTDSLPLTFDITPPEIALPTISGSEPVTEGDTETIETFDALKAASDEAASMGDAVFATLDPLLQGIEGDLSYTAADVLIAAAGIDDPDTVPPIPLSAQLPSMARMQLFEELLFSFRKAGEAAGASDPEAPGKIMAAYQALAIEKFVRRALIKVSLPDDKIISLTATLQAYGLGTAAVSAAINTGQGVTLTEDMSDSSGALGSYSLMPSSYMLGFDVVPDLTFYGGIETIKDYGYNFDQDAGVSPFHPDDPEVPMVNLQAILMSMKNGINFI